MLERLKAKRTDVVEQFLRQNPVAQSDKRKVDAVRNQLRGRVLGPVFPHLKVTDPAASQIVNQVAYATRLVSLKHYIDTTLVQTNSSQLSMYFCRPLFSCAHFCFLFFFCFFLFFFCLFVCLFVCFCLSITALKL